MHCASKKLFTDKSETDFEIHGSKEFNKERRKKKGERRKKKEERISLGFLYLILAEPHGRAIYRYNKVESHVYTNNQKITRWFVSRVIQL